jgi:hypothetical protein
MVNEALRSSTGVTEPLPIDIVEGLNRFRKSRAKAICSYEKSDTLAGKNPREDEITATVFEPLQFMPALAAWRGLCGAGLVFSADHATHVPNAHYIWFWRAFPNPSGPGADGWHHESPDAVFRFEFPDAPPVWLILEVKWDAGSSSHDNNGRNTQLAHQWIAVSQCNDAKRAHPARLIIKHTYLTKSFSEARKGIEETLRCVASNFDSQSWSANATALTWAELTHKLMNLTRSDQPQLRIWARDVSQFLGIMNILPFNGFKKVDPPDVAGEYNFRLRAVKLAWPEVCVPEPFRLKFNRDGRKR